MISNFEIRDNSPFEVENLSTVGSAMFTSSLDIDFVGSGTTQTRYRQTHHSRGRNHSSTSYPPSLTLSRAA